MSNAIVAQNEIEFIKGKTNILLVAPHGHHLDDENTGALTRLVAEQSGCYAIINEFYQKSEDDVNQEFNPLDSNIDDRAHEQNKRVNLNRFTEVERHLKNEFLNPLITYKNEIKKKFGNAIILWIHGAEDASVKGDINRNSDINPNTVKVLIGFGQHQTITERQTADSKIINQLKAGLTANSLTALEADVQSNKFCAYDANNMNQLFKYGKKFHDLNVDSVQLELRMTDCRDTDENIEKTAQDLVNAISPLMETEKPVVQKAYKKLAQIISRNYENATMEAGQYIVRTFYGGETDIEKDPYEEDFNYTPESIENARNKNSPIESSLRQLYAEINGDKESTTPSQAWIYNAVNLVVQWQDMKTELKENFYTYRNLLLSHKRALLQVKNIEEKKAVIQELQKQKLSVRDLKKQIAERRKQPDKETSIYSLITNPEELLSGKYSKLLSLEELKKIEVDKLKKIYSKMYQQGQQYQEKCNYHNGMAFGYKQYTEQYIDILTDIKTVTEYKENPSKDKKLKKSKTKIALARQ